MTLRHYIITLVAIGFIILNPIHLPFTLQYAIERQAGTRLGDFLADNQSVIIIGATVYFTAVMIPVYFWLWKRRRGATKQPARVAPTTNAAPREPGEPAYRGPGGGKRLPPSFRSRGGRRRRR